MKKVWFILLATCWTFNGFAQQDIKEYLRLIDSIEKSFQYERGMIELRNGVGKISIPAGFKYLNAEQAEKVLVDLWGNPQRPDMTLGLILPENIGVLGDTGYVFNIQYDEIGYVKDKDADKINYDKLLGEMQKEAIEANFERTRLGFESVLVVGWAAPPFYDKEKKILHWAKEIKFGDQPVNTLNYNIRVLGRKGVLVLNAISTMPNLPAVKNDLPKVLDIVQFNEGYQYKDFNPKVDQVAAWTIGGLVAGKVLAKAGFFVLLLKFWKLIAVGVLAALAGLWRLFGGKKEEDAAEMQEETVTENTPELAEEAVTDPAPELPESDNNTETTDNPEGTPADPKP